jgi:hypothetical protein
VRTSTCTVLYTVQAKFTLMNPMLQQDDIATSQAIMVLKVKIIPQA